MAAIAYPPVQQALEHIKALSADAETRRLAFVRERALHDEVSELRAAREIGKREGKLEGQREGLETALARLIQSGMSENQALQLLGL
jgi:predicted transposase YdaD